MFLKKIISAAAVASIAATMSISAFAANTYTWDFSNAKNDVQIGENTVYLNTDLTFDSTASAADKDTLEIVGKSGNDKINAEGGYINFNGKNRYFNYIPEANGTLTLYAVKAQFNNANLYIYDKTTGKTELKQGLTKGNTVASITQNCVAEHRYQVYCDQGFQVGKIEFEEEGVIEPSVTPAAVSEVEGTTYYLYYDETSGKIEKASNQNNISDGSVISKGYYFTVTPNDQTVKEITVSCGEKSQSKEVNLSGEGAIVFGIIANTTTGSDLPTSKDWVVSID